VFLPRQQLKPARGAHDKEHAMSQTSQTAVIGIDIGKNSFHIVGHDERGAIVLRQKWSRGQVEARFANLPPCLIGWRPVLTRIISAAGSRPWATMLG
jgi:transposase